LARSKPFLLASVTLISLALGAVIGPVAGRWGWVGAIGFAVFAAIGACAAARELLTDFQIAVFIAGIAGYITLQLLLEAAPPRTATVAPPTPGRGVANRRKSLGVADAAGGGAALAAFTGREILGPAVDVEVQRKAVLWPPVEIDNAPNVEVGMNGFDIDGLSPLITPNKDFYRIDTALVVPQVDTADWSFSIKGMVDEPFELTFDELFAMATLEEVVTLACVSNEVGDNLVGNTSWQGVPLASLLERAGVQSGATHIVGRSVDNFTTGFPTQVTLDGRLAMVAIAMNGEPLPAAHGFPARLVVPGLYGYVSATKWLKEIELRTLENFDADWIPRGWSKRAPIKTQSRIDTRRNGRQIDRGSNAIGGVAWGGIRSIEKVEVRMTLKADGPPEPEWIEANLGEKLSPSTWRQWFVVWNAQPGNYRVEVRATDGEGATQTDVRQAPAHNGPTGHHSINVSVGDGEGLADPNALSDPREALKAARALWMIRHAELRYALQLALFLPARRAGFRRPRGARRHGSGRAVHGRASA